MTNINRNKLHDLLINMAIFDEVAEMGSFSVTATNLQMTPSSVSKRIAKLEDELGVKLIERTTRTMRITAIGEQLRQHCQNMLNEANSVIEVAEYSQKSLAGDIIISAPKAFANHVLQSVVLDFLAKYPEINIQIKVSDKPTNLLKERIDCAIEISESPPQHVIAKPLIPVRQVVCASEEYLLRNTIPHHPSELINHQCLTLGEFTSDNQWTFYSHSKLSDIITISVTGRYVVNHSNMRLAGICKGLGIGYLPDFVIYKHQQLNDSAKIIEVLADWTLQSNYQGIAWLTYLPNKYQPKRLSIFIEYLQTYLSTDKTPISHRL